MGANQSNLSNPRYGYDLVVATTQASINGTMKSFLNSGSTDTVTMCYVLDAKGNPRQITLADLMAKSNNVNPFDLTNIKPDDPKLKNLSDARFLYGFKAKIGLPPGYAPITSGGPTLPDIITLTASTGSVNYNLMCSEFQVVEATYGPGGILAWLNESQPLGKAWLFNATIPLKNLDVSDISTLPTAVKNAANALPVDSFSVQQLLLVLDKAILNTSPSISGVKAGTPLYTALNEVFLGAYFAQMKKIGQPVLNYSIKQNTAPPASIAITNLELAITPYVNAAGTPVPNPDKTQKDASTLDYLCSTAGHNLPPATQFTWNWVNEANISTTAGAMAVNRNIFIDHLNAMLIEVGAAKNISRIPKPSIHVDLPRYWKDPSVGLTLIEAPSPGAYAIVPGGGAHVLTFAWHTQNSDSSHDGAFGSKSAEFDVDYYANSDIYIYPNKITLVNTFTIHGKIEVSAGMGTAHGDWAKISITSDFMVATDQNGNLTVNPKPPVIQDLSESVNANFILEIFTLGKIDDMLSPIKETFKSWAGFLAQQNIDDLTSAFNGPRSWIFPGGNTFAFQSAAFSDNQDLIATILYKSTN